MEVMSELRRVLAGVTMALVAVLAQADFAPLLDAGFDLGGEKRREARYYYFETTLTDFAADGERSAGHEFRLWLEARPTATGGIEYICRKFTLVRAGEKEELELPTLRDWTYTPRDGIDPEGRVFGIDHARFMALIDEKARFVNVEVGYMIYNAFIDFHALSDVFATGSGAGADVSALRRIGDSIVHAAANTRAPVGLGEAMKRGSEFRNGEVTLGLKGLSVVDGIPCALLEYDSGDSSYTMYMDALPGMEMVARGASHYMGDLYLELDSRWLRKATLYELVVSQVTVNDEASTNGVVERELLLEARTKREFDQR